MDLYKGLVKDNGIWRPPGEKGYVSYPEDAFDVLYELEDHSYWFQHRNDCIMTLVEQWHQKGTILMDLGGGNGYVTRVLQESGLDTILVEPGEAAIQNAQKRGIRNLIQASLDQCLFPPNSFGSIGLFDVLEHQEDHQAFLDRLRKFLIDDGMLFITVPAHKYLWSYQDNHAGHFRRYSRISLRRLLEDCGFTVKFDSYLFSWLIFPILLSRSMRYWLGLQTQKQYGHIQRDHIVGKILENPTRFFRSWELRRIRNLKAICFGSTCLMVAQKFRT